jgi:hypothetical protein
MADAPRDLAKRFWNFGTKTLQTCGARIGPMSRKIKTARTKKYRKNSPNDESTGAQNPNISSGGPRACKNFEPPPRVDKFFLAFFFTTLAHN